MNKLFETVRDGILGSLAATVGETVLDEYTIAETASEAVCEYASKNGIKLTVRAIFGENAVALYMDAESADGFAPKDAITMTLGNMKPDALLGSHHDCEWWMYPTFVNDYSELKPKTQSLFIKKGDASYHLLPLCGDNMRCEFEEGKLRISSDMSGLTRLSGVFLSVAEDADPYVAVDRNYKFANGIGAVRVPLIDGREFPEMFEGFGWCTWDAFYTEVSSEGIYKKLDEFKAKGIAVSWIIIDDGWQQKDDNRLTAFEINKRFRPCLTNLSLRDIIYL